MARFSYSEARKLLTPETIARIATRFHLPAERTKVQSDFHYKSITIMLASIDRGRIEPDMRIARIRLSDKIARLHPRWAAAELG